MPATEIHYILNLEASDFLLFHIKIYWLHNLNENRYMWTPDCAKNAGKKKNYVET